MAALPPFTPPTATLTQGPEPRAVRFRHPAYPASAPNLLVLMGADVDGSLDFDLALAACSIVAGVEWGGGGYLALNSPGPDASSLQRVDRPPDGLLRGRMYFFCVNDEDPLFKYPVVPSFQHWRFPHGGFDEEDGMPSGNLPPPWRGLRIPDPMPPRPTLKGGDAAMERDITCRVTGHMNAVEKAHLVPEGERLWFISNSMDRYCRRPLEVSPINDDKNIIVLRKDIHHLFDTRRLTLMPKRFGTRTPESAKLVSHVLLPSGSPELIGLYHNRQPQPITGISVECLYARFAWSIFTDEHMPFFQSDLTYSVRLWSSVTGEAEIRNQKGLDVKSISRIFESARSQSRSVSPKKRSRGSGPADGGYDCSSSVDENNASDDDSGGDSNNDNDHPPRGRPRKRRWDGDDLPGLSNSFTSSFDSMTPSSFASLPARPASRTPTSPPQNQAQSAASPAPALSKRIRVDPPTVEQ